MKEWFSLEKSYRKTVITQTSAEYGLPPAAIEKDWWVMIALRAIFSTEYANDIVFKGGTSLSKGWKIIERFSEDIDLGIHRSFFGFEEELSKTQVRKLRKTSCAFIDEQFQDKLKGKLIEQGIKEFTLKLLDYKSSDSDPLQIELKYQPVVDKVGYLAPRVLIEISSRSLKDPFENRELISFVGEKYPFGTFSDKVFKIPTVLPSRTFLEKVFLLHEEFQKPADKKIRSHRMSRHLYDISKLMDTEFCNQALGNMELYDTIVNHREMMNNISWVDYSTHKPTTIDFLPPDSVIDEWKKDYTEMQESMFYGETESFDELMKKLKGLKVRLNSIEV